MRLGDSASGHSAFPARSTRSKRKLKRVRVPPRIFERLGLQSFRRSIPGSLAKFAAIGARPTEADFSGFAMPAIQEQPQATIARRNDR